MLLESGIYEGRVFHERLTPKKHSFCYRVFMMYLDLNELDQFSQIHPFWGENKYALARFKRSDFYGDSDKPLTSEIQSLVQKQCGFTPSGAVRLLANLRYFGYIMNPLVTYYCFDKDNNLEAIIAEVTNTPWGEKHPYVLDCRGQQTQQQHVFEKAFTVSPFNPVDMTYHWASSTPSNALNIKIKNTQKDVPVFHAAMNLQRVELSKKALSRFLIVYPFFTVKVISTIYWQALKLFVKGVPFLGKNYSTSPSVK